MNHCANFLILTFWAIVCSVEVLGQSNCRLDLTAIKPVVNTNLAKVEEYEWDPDQRMEIMLLDSSRLAIITQDGCMRHHTKFQLELFHPLEKSTEDQWIQTLKGFIYPLFEDTDGFQQLWTPFIESFEQYIYVYGTNKPFDISLGSQDFICYVQDIPHQNPAIFIEQIGFLFKEKIRIKE
ncbi:MAG: hypothetical protein AAF694_14290 [Bacteroidota bacterium]